MADEKTWLRSLEFELEYRIREIIREHGLMPVDHPRVKRLFQNLTAVRRRKEVVYEGNPHRLCA